MRLKFNFFRRLNFRSWGQNSICSWGQICSLIFDSFDQEVEFLIMRLKFKKALLGISISWLFLWLTNRSWDRNCLIMHYFNFDLMIEVSTSWSKLSNINEQIWPHEQIWHHEQIEFRPDDWKFDLLKKLNFNLMKFDLMIISLGNL